MRILQVSNGLPPVDRGGVETYTLALAKALASVGHEVTVFCREASGDRPIHSTRDAIVEGVPARFVVNRVEASTPFVQRFHDSAVEVIFERRVDEKRPDVVHFQHTIGLSASLLNRAARLGVPYVATLHDYWYMCPQINLLRPDFRVCAGSHRRVNCYECIYGSPYPPSSDGTPNSRWAPVLPDDRPFRLSDAVYYPLQRALPGLVRRMLLRAYDFARLTALPRIRWWLTPRSDPSAVALRERARFMRAILRACPYIIAPSETVRQRYVSFGISESLIRVVAHGWDTSAWHNTLSACRPHGGVFRFGYLGSLLQHKGVDVIIRAFRELDGAKTELWIHGFDVPGSPYSHHLHELAGGDDRIHFAGPYVPSDLPVVMDQMDVLLVPSRWPETFSLVTHEAILAGLPVVASRIGAIPDAIEDGVNGILLPAGDTRAWVGAMRRLSEGPELVRALHQDQSDREVKSMEDHASELAQVYARLVPPGDLSEARRAGGLR